MTNLEQLVPAYSTYFIQRRHVRCHIETSNSPISSMCGTSFEEADEIGCGGD